MGFLLGILGDEGVVVGSLLVAVVPVLVLVWDTARDDAQIVRGSGRPDRRSGR